ncbi:17834_t:CDS:2 [Cetraspora pellucida]|uniref:17834_t:CDS:1 n=1 Tax=Cetraspora pellucida TaxID=1433469 RepID=A0A9N9A406_9GLOM|nr:17834_t:CDS:2 [Cetraspora pellucida]
MGQQSEDYSGSKLEKQINEFFEKKNIKEIPFDCFDENKVETISTELPSNSYKAFSEKYNKTMILNKIVFSQKYTFKDFITNLKQHQEVELHDNILKILGATRQKSPYGYDLLNAIIHGKRENEIPGTPKGYVKIYEECWQYNSYQRPSIQRVFDDLCALDSSNDIIMENSDIQMPDDKLEMGNLSVANLLQHYTELYNEKTKELELISSVIATFQKTS